MNPTRMRTLSTLVFAGILALGLSACDGAETTPTASPTSASPTPVPSLTPSETPTPTATAAAVTLPTDCATLGTEQSRAAVLDGLGFQGGDYTQFVRPAPANATLALGCDWFAGDATGLLVLISTAPATDVATAAAALPADGFTCTTDDFGAPVCQKTTPSTQYPVNVVETVVAREGVWVFMETSNVDGTPLLSDVVDGIFGITNGQ